MLNCFQWSKHLVVRVGAVLLLMVSAGCATVESSELLEYDILRQAKEAQEFREAAREGPSESEAATRIQPGVKSTFRPGVSEATRLREGLSFPNRNFKASYNNLSVAAFINEVFGNQLGLSFSINPDVQALSELVTLRLVEEVSPEELFTVAQQTLASYGIAMTAQANLYMFELSSDVASGDVPLVVTGRALPDVPASHRPIFMFVPIEVVNSNALRNWINPVVRGQSVTVQAVPEANALLLQGKQSAVEQVLSMIELMDQASLRGSYSTVIEPAYTDADELARDLAEVLKSQGYEASIRTPSGGIMVLPMKSSNKIVVLAATESVLEHSIAWAKTLDRQTTSGIENGVFSYRVRNTDVEYLAGLLNQLDSEPNDRREDREEERGSHGGRFIADTNRNAIVFRGSGREWVELLPSIKEMDQPTPSVLVEVILAEVTLNDQDETGFEFLARSGDVTFSTLGGLGLGGNGLSATLNRAGETRAVLNAFYKSDRANIRSRPRLMVKSGQLASIDVGNEIPFITSTSQSTDNPDAPVIQTINYRKTGVILEIEPVVHSSGYVDIRISQELSEAQQTSSSSIDSPTVFNRKLQTTVTLRDGGSVLLGGLISESNSNSDNGIKGLGRIPGVGRLFRADSSSTDRTELVMMVIPYVVENPDEAAEISDKALEFLELTR